MHSKLFETALLLLYATTHIMKDFVLYIRSQVYIAIVVSKLNTTMSIEKQIYFQSRIEEALIAIKCLHARIHFV